MRHALLILVGFLLSACAGSLPQAGSPAVLSPTALPTLVPSAPTMPSPTLAASPTDTNLLTVARTPVPTQTLNPTPTDFAATIAVSITHFFPLQPPSAGSFAEGTLSHGYPATDIFAVAGTKFVAVTNGVVDFVSTTDLWNLATDDPALRGGLSVAILGDDGLRYYGSHLSAIAKGIVPGVPVKVGQLLGLVGNSGDARTTLSHLHFGISRPSYPEDWMARRGQVDPYTYLLAWQDGLNVTPPLPEP
jgi:peptidoglycan LD-endopeptidase LytH